MNLELNLRFPTPEQVIVGLIEDDDRDESESLPFRGPLTVPGQTRAIIRMHGRLLRWGWRLLKSWVIFGV